MKVDLTELIQQRTARDFVKVARSQGLSYEGAIHIRIRYKLPFRLSERIWLDRGTAVHFTPTWIRLTGKCGTRGKNTTVKHKVSCKRCLSIMHKGK